MPEKSCLELAIEAIENNQLTSFLAGKNGYEISVNRYVPANLPTDFELVLRLGLYKYHKEKNDVELPLKLTKAIEQLLNGDCVDVWCAFTVCLYQIRFEIKGKSPFSIMSEELTAELKTSLQEHKEELKQCRLWQGISYENGLWQDIENVNKYLKSKYSVDWLEKED